MKLEFGSSSGAKDNESSPNYIIDESLLHNEQFLEQLFDENPNVLRKIDNQIPFDILVNLLRKNLSLYAYLTSVFQSNLSILDIILEKDASYLRYFPDKYCGDKKVAMKVVAKRPRMLEMFLPILRDDKQLVTLAVNRDSTSFTFASDRLKDDFEMAYFAVNRNACNYQFVGPTMSNNRQLAELAVKKEPGNILHVGPELINDFNLAKVTLNKWPCNLAKMGSYWQDNKDFVIYAMKMERSGGGGPYCFHLASKRLRRDKELIILAFELDTLHPGNLSKPMWADNDIICAALEKNLKNWRYVPESVKVSYEGPEDFLMEYCGGNNIKG